LVILNREGQGILARLFSKDPLGDELCPDPQSNWD
jgi:hypothetical protein